MTLADVVQVFTDQGWTVEYTATAAFRDGRGLPASAYRRDAAGDAAWKWQTKRLVAYLNNRVDLDAIKRGVA